MISSSLHNLTPSKKRVYDSGQMLSPVSEVADNCGKESISDRPTKLQKIDHDKAMSLYLDEEDFENVNRSCSHPQSFDRDLLVGNLSNVKVYKGSVNGMQWLHCKSRPYKGTVQAVWSYFKENADNNLYRCMLCSMVLKVEKHQNGNTVRILKKHLSQSGSKYYRCPVGCNPDQVYVGPCHWEDPEHVNTETLSHNPNLKKMSPNDYIWFMMNSTNQPMCFADDRAVIEVSKKLKELEPHSKHPACNSNNMKKLLDGNVADIETLLSREFKKGNTVLSTSLVINHKQEFEHKCITRMKELSNIHFASLVLDHWSDTRLRSFIGVVIVIWDKYQKKQRSFVIGMPETVNHSSAAIKDQLEQVIQHYPGLNKMIISSAADNASSVKNACLGLTSQCPDRLLHLSCVNHSLNVVNSKLVTEPSSRSIEQQVIKQHEERLKVKILDYGSLSGFCRGQFQTSRLRLLFQKINLSI